jgi:hypothetical protein
MFKDKLGIFMKMEIDIFNPKAGYIYWLPDQD